MKIVGFAIKALYGFFDYNVTLNRDLTFIYGENGSGKTTVLNMLDHVVSGEIYKLFKYNFKKIVVYYEKSNEVEMKSTSSVEIQLKNRRKQILSVSFDGDNRQIMYQPDYGDALRYDERFYSNRKFFEENPIAFKIRENFNYVFLPLNRLSYQKQLMDSREFRSSKQRLIYERELLNASEAEMAGVESLIRHSVSVINGKINNLNDAFRQDILKSALEMTINFDLDDFFKYFNKDEVIPELENTKEQYIKLLEELKTITTDGQKREHETYFDELIKKVEGSLNNSKKRGLPAELIGTYVELIKIRKSIEIYEKMEQKIQEYRTPINEFLVYINKFLMSGKDEKELKIDSLGRVYFTTNYTDGKVPLKFLSSGEKQIVTLISNLIFKVNRDKFTIFIVDEPELSLHLSWQKQFVETIHEINDNMQLVFATHSPEIVGRYSNKVYELQKHYKPVTKSDEGTETNFDDTFIFEFDAEE